MQNMLSSTKHSFIIIIIIVKYFGIIKITVHNVVTKSNINKLATCLKEAGKLFEFDQYPNKTENNSNFAATVTMGPNKTDAMFRSILPNGSRFAFIAAH